MALVPAAEGGAPTDSTKDVLKVPVFSGKADDWLGWKAKCTSVFQRKGLDALLDHLGDDTETPRDEDDGTVMVPIDNPAPEGPTHRAEISQERLNLKAQNRRAFALLITSVDDTPGPGKEAWDRVNEHYQIDGYKYGNFKAVWLQFEALWESIDLDSKIEVKKEYSATKFGLREFPTKFLSRFKAHRKQLYKLKDPVPDPGPHLHGGHSWSFPQV